MACPVLDNGAPRTDTRPSCAPLSFIGDDTSALPRSLPPTPMHCARLRLVLFVSVGVATAAIAQPKPPRELSHLEVEHDSASAARRDRLAIACRQVAPAQTARLSGAYDIQQF